MSDSQRSYEATPERLREAKKKGNLPRSNDLVTAVTLSCGVAVFIFLQDKIAHWGLVTLRNILGGVGETAFVRPNPMSSWFALLEGVLPLILAVMVVSGTAGLIVATVYSAPVFTTATLAPDWNRLNPMGGLKRIFSRRQGVELVKMWLKISLFGWICWSFGSTFLGAWCAGTASGAGVSGWMRSMIKLVRNLVVAQLILGIADGVYQKWEYRRELRMSWSEVKQEHRQHEGDPLVKSARRALARKLLKRRNLAGVKQATVVITNPIHLAVALKYTREMSAPRVVAKGKGAVADLIRKIARKHFVPVVEDVPLARALYRLEVEQEIPPELFQAVAEILLAVTRAEDYL